MNASSRTGRWWRDLALPGFVLCFVAAVRWSIGPVLGLGFVPLCVGPVAAVFVSFRSWGSFLILLLSIALAVSVPLIGLDSAAVWLQLFGLNIATVAATALAAATLTPLPLREGLGGGVCTPMPPATHSAGATDFADAGLTAAASTPGPLPPPPPSRGGGEEAAFAQSAVLVLWLAWLTWPIWLAKAWSPALDHLLDVQPLNAVGSVLIDLGDWTHQPIAYTYLLSLGQDVPYAPASSAWPAILLHGGVAIGAATVLQWRLARRPAATALPPRAESR